MDYSIKMEMIALLLSLIILLFHHDRFIQTNKRYQIFSICLLLTTISIALDIMTIFTLQNAHIIPIWLNFTLITLYFGVLYLTFSLMAVYCFYVLFEYATDKNCLKKALRLIVSFCALLFVLLIINIWTGLLFSFKGIVYCPGVLNNIGYFVVAIEIIMLCVCYYRNKQTASRSVRRLVFVIPTLVLILVFVQILLPNILLNGIITSVVNLILFINFQSNKIGQDDLTELSNRVSFFHDYSYFQKREDQFHLILIHLDDFGYINKKNGVKNGDVLLFNVARFLENFDDHYRVYRIGNTRFLMFGRHVEKAKGIDFANTVLQRFNDKWEHRDGKTLLKVNIAHMFLSAQESDENKIISQLEYTLSYARENSKNSILLFNEELCKMYERSTYVFTQMKKAIENESFEIYFQPVYDCQLKKFTTAESLLRLFDDKGKMISPSEFIPIAEKCGLIDDISWIVMKKIFNFFKTYPDFHIQSISVNLSMQQLTDETFIKNILLWRDKYDVSLEQIRVEITERSIAENPQIVEKTMLQLTNEGMKFYLDDFGIGYSNLSNMISLPFETIKLDMSLVRDIDTKPKKYQIIEALSHMLHTAHFIIVAEGVETKEEAIKIHELNINRIQGFYYAKPMPEKEFVQFIEKMD